MFTKLKSKIKENIPFVPRIFFGIALLSLCLHITFVFSESFADFFNRNISVFFRNLLAHLTEYIPFSLSEAFLIFLPVTFIVLIRYSFKQCKKSDREANRVMFSLLSVLAYVYSTFVFTFAAGYSTSPLAEKLDLDRHDLSAAELYSAAEYLVEKVNEFDGKIVYGDEYDSRMQYSNSEMIEKLNDTYEKVYEKYTFISPLRSKVKQIVLSEPMTYTHISGVYSFFTGEANLNVNFPDYILPFTAAHEMAHQRGIAREDEANFVAFLVCIESDDDYIRYSGYLNMYEYVANALYKADRSLYSEIYTSLHTGIKGELIYYDNFFDKYRNSVASDVAENVNNAYLTVQGTEGTKSYGMVTDLFVAYFEKNQ